MRRVRGPRDGPGSMSSHGFPRCHEVGMFARDAVVTTPMESLVWGVSVSPIWMESQKSGFRIEADWL